jgi:hypothetical protein
LGDGPAYRLSVDIWRQVFLPWWSPPADPPHCHREKWVALATVLLERSQRTIHLQRMEKYCEDTHTHTHTHTSSGRCSQWKALVVGGVVSVRR